MNSRFASRRPNSERLEIKIPPEQKRLAFEAAEREGLTAAQFVRRAIEAALNKCNASAA
jgi:uncharacterized protein (DUF1778 family)